jgi:hypothetical protein
MSDELVTRMRSMDLAGEIAVASGETPSVCLEEWQASGVRFVASDPTYERQYYRAVRELFSCVKSTGDLGAILQEGGAYFGCWLESTGTISAELLSRFLPGVAQRTFESFAKTQRDDGLFPYKLTADGAVFNQIQLVTPLARSVWNHYLLTGRDRAFLKTMFNAMRAYDGWIARNRDTRGTGAVEAFCCYDTGHDLSARFWHMPDTPYENDPAQYDTDNPFLPLIAPDLSANIACQRSYLARIADELGADGAEWKNKAEASTVALFARCFDTNDRFFYDQDRHGRPIRIQSDILLRVLACEIGNDAFFAEMLERYLLNTGKFFAKYPFTSLAMDDPRFNPAADHNTWCGPSNLLSLIRAPHSFEAHGRYVELNFALQPTLWALMHMERFAQTINPYTGEGGFTETYSPTMLGLIDFVERLSGILPRPEGTLWFTGLVPAAVAHRQTAHETAYARTVEGVRFELFNGLDESIVFRDGEELCRFPKGVRLVTDRNGTPVALIGLRVGGASGRFSSTADTFDVAIGPNQRLEFSDGRLVETRPAGYVPIGF